uniref:Uncharacterized protein n=1 Tax=uncultured bacterium A1Q1_fos_2140 TaxID=1256565 RepID=L7W0A4_9BACT|nr:hypothetical protein [uncultured bacterium A1Q1_fos_2140]
MHSVEEPAGVNDRLQKQLEAGYPVKKKAAETENNSETRVGDQKSPHFSGTDVLDNDSMALLMEGVVEYSAKNGDKPPFYHREQFIRYLADWLTQGNASQFPAEREAERSASPKNAAISAVELLGPKGLELYKLALEEEMYCFQYRLAVFNESTVHIAGEKFQKRPVVFIGGPSGSGKSHAAEAIRLKLCELLPTVAGNKEGKTFVSVDGGDVRKVSQMRKLLIRAANLQGFTGVSDLHAQSAVLEKVKFMVESAALNNKKHKFCIIRPETFSNWWINRELNNSMKKISQSEDSQLIFSMVIGEDGDNFQRVVEYMGESRAWKSDGFSDLTLDSLDLNETEKGLKESKEYGSMGFWFGKTGSNEAFEAFKRLQLDNDKPFLSFEIVNDLILVTPARDNTGQWEPAGPNSENALIVSRRVYEDWKTLRESDPVHCPDLPQYRKDHPITHLRMSPSLKGMEIDKQMKSAGVPSEKMQLDAENPIKLYLVGKSLAESQMDIADYFARQYEKFQCEPLENGFSFSFVCQGKRIFAELLFRDSFDAMDAVPEHRTVILCSRDNREGRNEVWKNIPSLVWASAENLPGENAGIDHALDRLMVKIEKMALEYAFRKLDLDAADIDAVIQRVALQHCQKPGFFQKETPATLTNRFNQFNGDAKSRLLSFLKDQTHGKDQHSFKFKVVAALTGCQANTKNDAMALIELLTDKVESENASRMRPQSV